MFATFERNTGTTEYGYAKEFGSDKLLELLAMLLLPSPSAQSPLTPLCHHCHTAETSVPTADAKVAIAAVISSIVIGFTSPQKDEATRVMNTTT